MEKSHSIPEASKGLTSQTVALLRDRLGKSYDQNVSHFTCFYHTDLKIGWIISEGNILIYNNANVYFELKLPSKLPCPNASQVVILNNETGAYLILADANQIYSRIINEEYDIRYSKANLSSLTAEETIKCLHLMTSPVSSLPCLIIGTTTGRIINTQILIEEDLLQITELVIEQPKRMLSSLTSFFSSGNTEDTNIHYITSDTKSKDTAYIFTFNDKSLNVWTLSGQGPVLWRINVESVFKKYEVGAGDVQRFRVIGQEVLDRTHEDDTMVNMVIQVVTRNSSSPHYFVLYYILRININLETQKYVDFEPGQLSEAKEYTQLADEVNCLVCTNEGSVTYIFICYNDSTHCINVFSDHIDEELINVRIIGHGILHENVRYFLLYGDREILSFSLLREQSFKQLMRYHLKDIEESNKMRKKIKDASLDHLSTRTQGDDERKVLEMIRGIQGSDMGLNSSKTDLLSLRRSYTEETFRELLMNVTKNLIDDPIRDSMVCNNQREEVDKSDRLDYITDNPAMIDWSLNTKLSRVNVIKSFLEQAGFDFEESLNEVEEKLVFFQAIKRNHDELCKITNHYQSLTLLNKTIQDIVANVHKVSKEEIRQKGTTSSLIFYSYPMKGAEHFILTLCKNMYDKKHFESLREDTLMQLSVIFMDCLKAVQEHRAKSHPEAFKSLTKTCWTMDTSNFLAPIVRVIELMPPVVKLNESVDLNERMYELSHVVLTELREASLIESRVQEHDQTKWYELYRPKLIGIVEEFTPLYAIDLAIEFCDNPNATRLAIKFQDYDVLYRMLEKFKSKGLEHQVFMSMDWIISDYNDRLKRRKKGESFTFKLQLFDIFEDKYEELLLKYIDEKCPRMRLIYQMRKAQFTDICDTCEDLEPKSDDRNIKSLLNSIREVNKVPNEAS